MKKVMLLLFSCFLFIGLGSAVNLTLSNPTATSGKIDIVDANNLYAYEAVLSVVGSILSVSQAEFLGAGEYNYSQYGAYLYVYGSKLTAGESGVSGSGNLFNVTFNSGGSVSLYSLTALSASDIVSNSDGTYVALTEEAEPECGDGACNNGESCTSCPSDCGSCPASTGGGGGASVTKYYSLKILTPGEITISDSNYIEVPLSLSNDGSLDLQGITLSAEATLSGSKTDDVQVVLAKNYIESLKAGSKEQFNVRINVNTKNFGNYKLTVYADIASPQFSDYGEFYIELKKVEASEAEQNMIFAEKLINKNVECLELNEVINEAKRLYESGDYRQSVVKLKEAVDACSALVSQNEMAVVSEKNELGLIIIIVLLTLTLIVIGLILYIYKRSGK